MTPEPDEGAARVNAIAAGWGLAEATLFFFVPDVFLSAVALRSRRLALVACLWATAGALVGGALMYAWGTARPAAAEEVLDAIPAIAPATIERVGGQLAERGALAVFLGPLRGRPYKIYAVEAGKVGMGFVPFLLVTIPARLVRFVLVSLLAAWIARGPLAAWAPARRRLLHAAAWAAFYAVYFTVVPG